MLKIVLPLFLVLAFLLFSFSGSFNQKLKKNIYPLPINSTFPTQSEIKVPDLTLSRIFDQEFDASLYPKEKIRVLIATGDIIPARTVNFLEVKKDDFLWPYQKTGQFLKNADVTLANLEAPLFAGCPATDIGMTFCGDAKNIEGLSFAGIDVVNLANNHAGNYGEEGLDKTEQLLQNAGILATGRNGPVYFDVKGKKFAFLGYNDIGGKQVGLSWADTEIIKQEVVEAKKQADLVIVSFHFGNEYTSQPTQRQKSLAHLAIDSGADLVIGNHPHWIQALEIYQGKLINYALGNFIFDQTWSLKTRQGIVGKYYFYDQKLAGVEFHPVLIKDAGQPIFLADAERQTILEDLKQESLKLASASSQF